ncbi:helix-turn-helix domain-containing protein [uncultured Prevotella sp.]|uniref:helix-turn-helix domain-containing protein n=1 Tax=uncultured Prevotella sp. TaxID=159272 RepID=UPI0027E38F06|nr:helix-turn-helix domain-containing protein [uncultured Prevotella sp.]
MYSEINFSTAAEPRLFLTTLSSFVKEQQMAHYGAIIICRSGKANIQINFDDWQLFEGAVITIFPNDVIRLMPDEKEEPFLVEMLQYDAAMLREASLQLEHTVYEQLRQDRCRQDSPVVTNIINNMFRLLHVYFDQVGCTCISQLVLLQLKAFFIGFHEYLQRNPRTTKSNGESPRMREMFNRFMMLVERDYKLSRDVAYYASQMNITPKYLTLIVRQMTHETPKHIIDHYTILQLKLQLTASRQSVKEIAWEYHFNDVSFFCRYFKRHTGLTPMEIRTVGNG